MRYSDDVKPAITSIQEFTLVEMVMTKFKTANVCQLHRDPASNKCKVLALGRWKGTLTQEDIPLPYQDLNIILWLLGIRSFRPKTHAGFSLK